MNLFDYNLQAIFQGNPYYTYNTALSFLCFDENNNEFNEKKLNRFKEFLELYSQKCVYQSLLFQCFENEKFTAKEDHLSLFYSLSEHELELFYQFHIQFFSIDIEKVFYNPESANIFFLLALLYAKFPNHFYRPIKHFKGFKNVKFVYMEETFMADLICHLLVKYERPKLILRHFYLLTFTEIVLFILALDGKNIRNCPLFIHFPTKKEFSNLILLDIPILKFENKIFLRCLIISRFIQVRQNLDQIRWFLRFSKMFISNPELFMFYINDWKKAFELIEDDFRYDYILREKIDFLDATVGKNGFTLAGRNYRTLNRLSYEWHQSFIIDNIDISNEDVLTYSNSFPHWRAVIMQSEKMKSIPQKKWEGIDILDYYFDFEGKEFFAVQLKRESELQIEGNLMSHCVSSYVDVCSTGESSIWSIRKKVRHTFKPYITVEIQKKQLVQASKKANRQPSKKDFQMLKIWFDMVGFDFGEYYER
ncbi:MAG: PcfJ domain-containing protein [Flavobacteriia bacterium]|nr:PcfJ domain-containing protein [Flavobacteriia bacterium]